MKSELVPHVDQQDNLLGVVERSEAYKKGLIHRAAHGIIQNSQGLYLVQQRSFAKSTWPGHYDLGIAETVKPDETYKQALERGLSEELGLRVPKLQLIREKYYQEYFWDTYQIFGMVCLFKLKSDQQPTLQDGEVKKVDWMSKKQVTQLVRDQSQLRTPWLINDWEFYLQNSKV